MSQNTILIIEDEKQVRSNLIELLEAENYLVHATADGEQGIQTARQVVPDLILCDIMLPNMDGHEVLRRLRLDPQLTTTPVVFLTARSQAEDIRDGMNLGADDYLTKPCPSSTLLDVVKVRIEKNRRAREVYGEAVKNLRKELEASVPSEIIHRLRGIISFSEVLQRHGNLLDRMDVIDAGRDIHTLALKLCSLIEDFVLFVELESQDRIPNLEDRSPVEVSGVVKECARAKALEFDRESDLSIHIQSCQVNISRRLVHRVMEALLDNAFRFSTRGSAVTVEGQIQEGRYEIEVKDNGRGMSTDQLAQLKELTQSKLGFYRSSLSGLGLQIAWRLLERVGGGLHIESAIQVGTRAHVRLPLS